MVRRLATLLGVLSIGLVSFCAHPLPAIPQGVPNSIYVPASTATGTGSMGPGDIAGASVCRVTLAGTWSGTVRPQVESLGSSSFASVPLFDDNNIEYKLGATADGDYVFYPESAGAVQLYVSAYASGTVAQNGINCSPAAVGHPNTDSQGSQYVAFATPQPINIITGGTPLPVTTPVPISVYPISIGSTPLPVTTPVPPSTYPISILGTPLPVTTPVPLPTDVAGRVSVTTPAPLPTDATGRVSVTTPSPLPTDVGGRLSVSTPAPVATIYVSNYALFPTPSPLPTDGAGRISVSTPPPTTTVGITGTVPVSLTIVSTPIPVLTPPPTTSVGISSLGSVVLSGTTLPVGGTVGVSGTVTTSGTTTISVGATPLPVLTAPPLTSISISNFASFPTPIPTAVPQPLPTASAGATPPVNAPWTQAAVACQYNGLNSLSGVTLQTPAPTLGNYVPCQASASGAVEVTRPSIRAFATIPAGTNGTYMTSILEGETSCRMRLTGSGATNAQVNVQDDLGGTIAGPYAAGSGTNTATFQLITAAAVTTNSISAVVSSNTGTSFVMNLYCSDAVGVVWADQAGAPWSFNTPYTVASPLPVTTPAPYPTGGAGNLSVTGSSVAISNVSTFPTPVPITVAASPAPANVLAQGYNASGAAAPIICTGNNEISGAITSAYVQFIAGIAAEKTYICEISITAYGTAAGTIQLAFGSGTNCATGTTTVGPTIDFVGSATVPTVFTRGTGVGLAMAWINTNKSLCIKNTGTLSAGHYDVIYEQF